MPWNGPNASRSLIAQAVFVNQEALLLAMFIAKLALHPHAQMITLSRHDGCVQIALMPVHLELQKVAAAMAKCEWLS